MEETINYEIVPASAVKIDELSFKLEQYLGYYVFTYARPAYETVMHYLRLTMIKLKPFLIATSPIIAQLVLMGLGMVLIPVLGPFGPLLVQFVGQLIMYVLKLVLTSIGNEGLLHNPFDASTYKHATLGLANCSFYHSVD